MFALFMNSAASIKYFACLILTSPALLFAQEVQVLDESTGVPVDHVAIFNQDRNISVITDRSGQADISAFNRTDSIFFQHQSYETIAYTLSEIDALQGLIHLRNRYIMMEEFVVTALKDRNTREELPFDIDVLESKSLSLSSYQTSADILLETGNIMIQKSQGGGGSPILRGFEANRILLVIDGIRMNNAIYRSGHLQNSITVDNSILDRVEIIYGPASVLYGSDALGGVIHYHTKEVVNTGIKANPYVQYSTANRGYVLHADVNAGTKKFGNLISFTAGNFGDVRSGRNRKTEFGDWGLSRHYAGRTGTGQDTVIINPDPHRQIPTGYKQYDLLNKSRFSPGDKLDLTLNLQYSTSSDIPRYDQLNDYKGGQLSYAEWYYGPQQRFLGALQAEYRRYNRAFTNMSGSIAYQKINEERHTRRFGIDEKRLQDEEVYVYTVNLDFLKILNPVSRLLYGFDYAHNQVNSRATYRNITTGEVAQADLTRYPGGGSQTHSASLYANYKWSDKPKFFVNTGLRYNFDHLESRFTGLPSINRIKISNGAVTGSASMVYHPGKTWQFNLILSTGFRNPNVDDYGKVRAKGDFVTVPNDQLLPEYTYNAEFSTMKSFSSLFDINATLFYSFLNHAIVRTEHSINGADSILYDGQYYQMITNSNAAQANIYGLSLGLFSPPGGNFNYRSTLNLIRGRDITNQQPMGHIPPAFGRTSFSYRFSKITAETYALYSGLKSIDDMSPFGEDNADEGLDGVGYPAWYTLNVKLSYEINTHLVFQVGLENLLDRYYKSFASGVAGPGRNLVITLRGRI